MNRLHTAQSVRAAYGSEEQTPGTAEGNAAVKTPGGLPAAEPGLKVTGLNTQLGGRHVLRDVTVTFPAATLSGLIGPNGAGKTTFLRSVLGVIPIQSGTISVAGSSGRGIRQLIGYVPQRHEFAWDFPIDVRGVIMSGRTRSIGWLRQPGKRDFTAVYEAAAKVQIEDLLDRPVGQLSGGQRQRVLLARALAHRPKVLLFDEPFTGLDMPSQDSLVELFHRLTEDGTTLIMSTHDLGGAVDDCGYLALLNGSIKAQGHPASMRDKRLWMDTFKVRENSALLRTVGVA